MTSPADAEQDVWFTPCGRGKNSLACGGCWCPVADLERLRRREAALREALLGLLGSTCIESTMREVVDAQDHAQAVLEQAGQPAQQVTVTAQASSWAGGWNEDAVDDSPPVDDE